MTPIALVSIGTLEGARLHYTGSGNPEVALRTLFTTTHAVKPSLHLPIAYPDNNDISFAEHMYGRGGSSILEPSILLPRRFLQSCWE